MNKIVYFDEEAKRGMLSGVDAVARAVVGTLGPAGRNAYIKGDYENEITNDGATIAAEIRFRDELKDLGADVVRNASNQTNDDAGDGTTTTAVLVQACVRECLARQENPADIRQSLLEASKEAVQLLLEQARKSTEDDLKNVALISAEDKNIARLVTELTQKLGDKAIINVDDSKTYESSYEVIPGYDAPVGFVSPLFVTDKETQKAVLEDVHVLVSEKKIQNVIDIKPLWEDFKRQGITRCVVVCDDIDDAMIGLFAHNKLQGTFQTIVVKAKGEILEDIAAAVGARPVGERNGLPWKNVGIADLGKCEKVVVDHRKSIFFASSVSGGYRANELDSTAENESNLYIKQKIKDRAAKLRGGIGVLRIGAHSDKERTFLKRKAEDAIKAVQAAAEEGVVEGGGMALFRVSKKLGNGTLGSTILKKVLQEPLRQIAKNAGKDYNDIVARFQSESDGWDAKRDVVGNLWEMGIIDPVKVEKCALENAVSAAASFITAFVAIVNDPNDRNPR